MKALAILVACGSSAMLLAIGCASNDNDMSGGTMASDRPGMSGRSAPMNGMQSDRDLIQVATGANMERVTTVVRAIQAAELVEPLRGEGPFTVFAPVNEAFEKLPAGTVDELLKPENKEQLQQILLYHVHQGQAIRAADVRSMQLSTLQGNNLRVRAGRDGNVMINDARVIKTDVMASNGVIHWIDTVLMPE